MKTIPLSKGYFALVDDEDFEWLSGISWCVKEFKRHRLPSIWYAIHSRKHLSHLYMHREIAKHSGFSNARNIDHKDNNGLNNQKHNLRPCTQSQNGGNQRKRSGTSSKFKGVTWVKRNQNWISRIMCNRVQFNLGNFQNEIDAAKAYDVATREKFGEFARTNFQ